MGLLDVNARGIQAGRKGRGLMVQLLSLVSNAFARQLLDGNQGTTDSSLDRNLALANV